MSALERVRAGGRSLDRRLAAVSGRALLAALRAAGAVSEPEAAALGRPDGGGWARRLRALAAAKGEWTCGVLLTALERLEGPPRPGPFDFYDPQRDAAPAHRSDCPCCRPQEEEEEPKFGDEGLEEEEEGEPKNEEENPEDDEGEPQNEEENPEDEDGGEEGPKDDEGEPQNEDEGPEDDEGGEEGPEDDEGEPQNEDEGPEDDDGGDEGPEDDEGGGDEGPEDDDGGGGDED